MTALIQYQFVDAYAKEGYGGPPLYATEGSAAVDLRPYILDPIVIKPFDTVVVGTGLKLHIKDPNLVGVVLPRSGLGSRGLIIGNLVGAIDSDFLGEIKVSLWNRTDKEITVQPFDRVVQLLFVPVVRAIFHEVEAFEQTARGEGGYGSTGSK